VAVSQRTRPQETSVVNFGDQEEVYM